VTKVAESTSVAAIRPSDAARQGLILVIRLAEISLLEVVCSASPSGDTAWKTTGISRLFVRREKVHHV